MSISLPKPFLKSLKFKFKEFFAWIEVCSELVEGSKTTQKNFTNDHTWTILHSTSLFTTYSSSNFYEFAFNEFIAPKPSVIWSTSQKNGGIFTISSSILLKNFVCKQLTYRTGKSMTSAANLYSSVINDVIQVSRLHLNEWKTFETQKLFKHCLKMFTKMSSIPNYFSSYFLQWHNNMDVCENKRFNSRFSIVCSKYYRRPLWATVPNW